MQGLLLSRMPGIAAKPYSPGCIASQTVLHGRHVGVALNATAAVAYCRMGRLQRLRQACARYLECVFGVADALHNRDWCMESKHAGWRVRANAWQQDSPL